MKHLNTLFIFTLTLTAICAPFVYLFKDIEIGSLGDLFLGISGLLGIALGINKYLDIKREKVKQDGGIKKTTINNEEFKRIIDFLVTLKDYLNAIYYTTSLFGLKEDPDKKTDQKYHHYIQEVRESRYQKHIHIFEKIDKEAKYGYAYLPKQIIEKCNEIFKKWSDLNINFSMWYDLHQNGDKVKTGEYWGKSHLKKEEYDKYLEEIDHWLSRLNKNYSKEIDDITFIFENVD